MFAGIDIIFVWLTLALICNVLAISIEVRRQNRIDTLGSSLVSNIAYHSLIMFGLFFSLAFLWCAIFA